MDWKQLRVVVGSEMLDFEGIMEDEQQPQSCNSSRGSNASPRGEKRLPISMHCGRHGRRLICVML